jgi:hypothetical protein
MIVRKYAFKRCTRCEAYIEIAIPKMRSVAVPVYAVTGRCLDCGFGLCWLVFLSKLPARRRRSKPLPLRKFLERLN